MMKTILKIVLRLIFIPIEFLLLAFFGLLLFIILNAEIDPPKVQEVRIAKRKQVGKDHFTLGNNYLKKNEFGIWEMYVEGDPYERGLIYGELAKELVQRQEDIFVEQINSFIPGAAFQQFLRLFIGFFNADLPQHISLENQQEIYGISQQFSDRYNYIAPKYTRILNYHAAHDIGHALNDYSIVGCTSFSLHGSKTEDGALLLGRNFDFYVGDDFAEDKLILFVKPTKGYGFVSYSWAGFTGVASGMNEAGLTVTINASKSDLPRGAKTPISLLAREILQYASSIKEAVELAKKRETFVSESLLIGSAKDGKSVIIEKSPAKMDVYDSEDETLICANHYQSKGFRNDKVNRTNIRESDSHYRFERVQQLLQSRTTFTASTAVEVLRDQAARDGDTLGMGNPRAVNQLLAHHSVIMQPQMGRIYFSTKPYQLGAFVGYDLKASLHKKSGSVVDTIPPSPFLKSEAYRQFLTFRKLKKRISDYLIHDQPLVLKADEIDTFITSNGASYVTYEMLGKYFMKKKNFTKAESYFEQALTQQVASQNIRKELITLRNTCKTNR